MDACFITHPEFAHLKPLDLFRKEHQRISPPAGMPQNRHFLFRRKVVLPRFDKATLKITADDYYKLYINGSFVTQGPAPSYPHCYYYNEIDLAPFLTEGENTFAVHTFYQGLVNRVWVSGDLRASFFCSLSLDGKTYLVSDESWLTEVHSGYTSLGITGYDTAFLERYDSAAPEVGFEMPDYDDSTWQNAAVYENADYTLLKQPTKQLVFEKKLPVEIKSDRQRVFIDFGQEAVGNLYLVAKGQKGDKLTLRFAEELNEDGTLRYRMRCNCLYEEEWLLSGGTDTLRQYDYKAFRYAEVILPEKVSLEEIAFNCRHYPFVPQISLSSENKDLLSILALCQNTVMLGTQEVFVDCPTREKGQYLGDAAITGRAHAVLTGDTTMLKKAILDFCHTAFVCPGLLAVSGASFMQEIADYSLLFPALVAWCYHKDGDLAFVEKTLPYIEGVFRYFSAYADEKGLLSGVWEKWNLVDWPANLRDGYDFPLTNPVGEGFHNLLNAFWCGFLDAYDELLAILLKPITKLTAKTKKAFIERFYDEESGLFCDTPHTKHSAVHSSVLPLLFDIGTEDEALKKRLIARIGEKRLTSMGVYMAYFALAALVKQGEKTLAEALACDENCWLRMLREGATTTFEAWGKNEKQNCSLFHPWATAPLIVFMETERPY